MTELALIHFDQARQELALATKVDEVKAIRDKAEAMRAYAKQVGYGLEMQNQCAEIKLRAERRAGELLAEMDLKPGRPFNPDLMSGLLVSPAKLADLGLTEKESSRWQRIADMPEERFEQHIAEAKAARAELTEAALLRVARLSEPQPIAPLPDGKYRVIYADPPWQYGDRLTEGYGPADHHYPTMAITDLCALPVLDLSGEDAVLFLWTTSPMLEAAFGVIKAWGFAYKTSFVWDKIRHNFGHYNSVRHEFLLICTRGSCLPETPDLLDSVVSIERTDHSTKPAYFRELIERLYPSGKKIELFARETYEGWDAWGNQVPSAIVD